LWREKKNIEDFFFALKVRRFKRRGEKLGGWGAAVQSTDFL